MKTNPLVSIIIPTYNRASTIMNSINSALNQTYSNIEIIVVDDGSTDNTRELVKNFSTIEYVFQQNGGQAKARNTGLMHATGEIIASLDSDDIWYPTFLEKCVGKLVEGNLDFVFANWHQERKDGDTFSFLEQDIFVKPYFDTIKDGWVVLNYEAVRSIYLQSCPSPSSSLIIKRSSIHSGWDTNIKVGDDWYMYLDVVLSGERTAAFTLDKLWRKGVNEQNIYDGRKRDELLENFYIADLQIAIHALKDRLTPSELRYITNKHVYGLVELAKHSLIREFNPIKASKLFAKALKVDRRYAFRCVPEIIRFGIKRNMGSFKPSKDRPY